MLPPAFTGKERDAESGLDYFGARYFSGPQGRSTSADPVFFQKSMLTDPQRFNLYSYVRNNPLRFIDPKGEAIELTCGSPDATVCENERKNKLALLQQTLGAAGSYLYDNLYKGKHYIGIYKNGPDGKGPEFASINEATQNLSRVIDSPTVARIEFAQEGQQVGRGRDILATIGSIDFAHNKGPGFTAAQGDGTIKSYIIAPGLDTGTLPGLMMTDGAPGQLDTAVVLWHELGHADAMMQGLFGKATNDRALYFEDTIRRLKDPSAPLRTLHDPPERC